MLHCEYRNSLLLLKLKFEYHYEKIAFFIRLHVHLFQTLS